MSSDLECLLKGGATRARLNRTAQKAYYKTCNREGNGVFKTFFQRWQPEFDRNISRSTFIAAGETPH
jgi:hypothetical protein